MKEYPVITADGHLAVNTVWNIPQDVNEVRGMLVTRGMWRIPVSYRALTMDMHGRVFGIRTMTSCRESGHDLEGRVSIENRKYRAFTSSRLFTRMDGSLCDVAINYACGTPDKVWRDPLIVDRRIYRRYLKDLYSRYFYERGGTYYNLKEYARALELIADGTAAQYPWCEYEKTAADMRALLLGPMHWV